MASRPGAQAAPPLWGSCLTTVLFLSGSAHEPPAVAGASHLSCMFLLPAGCDALTVHLAVSCIGTTLAPGINAWTVLGVSSIRRYAVKSYPSISVVTWPCLQIGSTLWCSCYEQVGDRCLQARLYGIAGDIVDAAGRRSEGSQSAKMIVQMMSIMVPWMLAHWEEYHSGIMLYGNGYWGVTEANYLMVLLHLFTAAVGPGLLLQRHIGYAM